MRLLLAFTLYVMMSASSFAQHNSATNNLLDDNDIITPPLTIYDVLYQALDHSRVIRAARQDIEAARQEKDISNAAYLPQISSVNSGGYLHEPSAVSSLRGSSISVGLELRQRLYSFGRKGHDISAAETYEDEAIANLILQENTTLYDTSLAFIRALRAQKVSELRNFYYESLQKHLLDAEDAVKEGLSLSRDVSETRSSLLRASAERIRSNALLSQYKKELSQYIGIVPDKLSHDDLRLFFKLQPDIGDIANKLDSEDALLGDAILAEKTLFHDHALQEAPTLDILQAQYNRNDELRQMEDHRILPDIDIVGSANLGKTGSNNTNTQSILVQMQSSIYDGGLSAATAARYKLEMDALQTRIEEERTNLRVSIDNAINSYKASYQALYKISQALEEWKQILSQLKLSLKEEIIRTSDTKRYEQDYINLLIEYSEIEYQILEDLLLLYNASYMMHRVYSAKEQVINAQDKYIWN